MSAYIVFTRERLRDKKAFDIYTSVVAETLAGYSAEIQAAYGKFESLEGAPIDGAVIVKFPSLKEAKAWYESPAYRAARKHRFEGADYRVFITEGV